jgi:hypothetical protein
LTNEEGFKAVESGDRIPEFETQRHREHRVGKKKRGIPDVATRRNESLIWMSED